MMLGIIFTLGIIVASVFLAWTYTKHGRNWLKSL
jgi:hypothetical protein